LEDGNHSYLHLVDKFSTRFGTSHYDSRKTFLGKDSVVNHRVVSIAAGNQHYCAVTDEAMWNLYTWGHNKQGQLGLGEMFEDHNHLKRQYFRHPTRVWSRRLTHRIRKAICGATFTVCILSNDHVYGFGTGLALDGPSSGGDSASSSSSSSSSSEGQKKKKKKSSWFGLGGGMSTFYFFLSRFNLKSQRITNTTPTLNNRHENS
jgi:alpha-tubulin suppressor-like RCC1 family protein